MKLSKISSDLCKRPKYLANLKASTNARADSGKLIPERLSTDTMCESLDISNIKDEKK